MLLFPILKLIQFVLHNIHFWLRYIHFYEVVSLQQFCPHHSERHKSQILILSIAPLDLHHSCNPPRHALNQILAYCCINLVPLLFHPSSKFEYSLRVPFVLLQPSVGMISQVFNGIKVRWFQTMLNHLFHDFIAKILLSQTCPWGHYLARIHKMTYYPLLLEILWTPHEKQCKIVLKIPYVLHFIPQENVHWFLSN